MKNGIIRTALLLVVLALSATSALAAPLIGG